MPCMYPFGGDKMLSARLIRMRLREGEQEEEEEEEEGGDKEEGGGGWEVLLLLLVIRRLRYTWLPSLRLVYTVEVVS